MSVCVVELFTSEGCSSCPPADRLLAELAERRRRGDQVLTLGFHVDYWDYLGWREPFGDPAWTARQRTYASAFGARALYTPQAVVNGTTDVVGSRGRELRKAVDVALRRPSVALSATAVRVSNGFVVEPWFGTGSQPSGTSLSAVLVQSSASSRVLAGENAGRTLDHVDIVRSLTVAGSDGVLRLAIPQLFDEDALGVVVLVQDRDSLAVVGATAARMSP